MAKSGKPTVKSVTEAFEKFKGVAKAYLKSLQYPQRRALLSVAAVNAEGKLNGMTIVEIVTIVNLMANQGEKVYITVQDKTITMWAEKEPTPLPAELRELNTFGWEYATLDQALKS